MKTIITLTVLLGVFTSTSFASSYEEAMKTNIEKMKQTSSSEEFTQLAGQFQRIANAEKSKWLPGYYAAYCYVNTTFVSEMKPEQIQEQLDLAQAEIDNIMKIAPEESEIYVLQAFIFQLRITDMMKGMKYSGLSNEALTTAEKLNSDNPRVFYLRGTNTFHTPAAFGGGKDKAKPLFQKAAAMFESQKPANELMPDWGKEHNTEMLSQCNEE